MHRFRRKSETKRSAAVPGAPASASPQAPTLLPTLPPASDFRTSLILPSLSRRFTILRNSSGEPLSPAQVRSRLAEQRSRGLANHISQEEEDMMIEELEHMRSTSSNASTDASLSASQLSMTNPDGSSSYLADSDVPGSSLLNSESTFSSSRPGVRKRSDNNLFTSSGRLREEEYIRTAARSSNKNTRSGATSGPVTPPRARDARAYTPGSPHDSNKSLAPSASPELIPSRRAVTDFVDPFAAGNSRQKPERPVTPGLVRRASLALAQALRDLEKEMGALQEGKDSPEIPELFDDDDHVLAPFQAVPHPSSAANPNSENVTTSITSHLNYVAAEPQSGPVSPVTNSSRHQRMNSASPVPNTEARVPGYIPGMHRPITPVRDRDSDFEEFPTYSNTTTPRASSPTLPLRTSSRGGVNSPSRNQAPQRQRSNTSSSQGISSPSTSETVTPTTSYFSSRDRSPLTSSFSAISPHFSSSWSGNAASSLINSSPRSNGLTSSQRSPPRPVTPATTTPVTFDIGRSGTMVTVDDPSQYGSSQERSKSFDTTRFLAPALPESPLLSTHNPVKGWSGFPTQRDVDASRGAGMNATAAVLASFREHDATPVSLRSLTRSPAGDKVISSSSRPGTPAIKGAGLGTQYSHSHSSSVSSAFFQADKFGRPSESGVAGDLRSLSPNGLSFQRNLILSPLLNSSHSSLVSASSSFHSGEGSDPINFKKLYELDASPRDDLEDSDPTLVNSDDSEEILVKLVGLNALDITAMHDRLFEAGLSARTNSSRSSSSKQTTPPLPLVSASVPTHSSTPVSPIISDSPPTSVLAPAPTVIANPNLQEDSTREIVTYRPPSRTTPSPAPPSVKSRTPDLSRPSERSTTPGSDHASRRGALLRSVMDSIASPCSTPPPPAHETVVTPRSPPSHDNSPATTVMIDLGLQKQQELTDALFGGTTSTPEKVGTPDEVNDIAPPSQDARVGDDSSPKPSEPLSSPSFSPSPSPPQEVQTSVAAEKSRTQLHIDVERKAAAATAALKSPSLTNIPEDANAMRRRQTKRIKTSKISNPLLVSSTTSLDTIPINSPSVVSLTSGSPSSSLSRFSLRRLRGSLRSKVPNGDEVTPWTTVTPSPTHSPSNSTSHIAQSLISSQSKRPPASTAPVRTLPTPSASAKPRSSLKGLMSRIMRVKRDGDPIPEAAESPQPMQPQRPSTASPGLRSQTRNAEESKIGQPGQVASLGNRNAWPASPVPEPPKIADTSRPTSPRDDVALRRFLDAGSSLGLDHDALNDLLSRSGSITSQTSRKAGSPSPPNLGESVSSIDHMLSSNDSVMGSLTMPTHQPLRRSPTSGATEEPQSSVPDTTPVVVRRTLVLPQDFKAIAPTEPHNAVARKPSLKQSRHNRSTSWTSTQSGRSIIDRAPTPPPSRSVRHRSMESSPPVPSLPSSLSRDLQPATSRRVSHQSSTFEAQNSGGNVVPSISVSSSPMPNPPSVSPSHQLKPRIDVPVGPSVGPSAGPGQALQRVEYSNGHVVWSVVDGLRAGADDDWDLEETFDDSQSYVERDPRRGSEISGVSSARGDDDPVQLHFKEHKRMSSKESNASYTSRRRVLPPSGMNVRPETKVFFSSAAEIEKLIESISRGAEAGSFNIIPQSTTTQLSPEMPLQLSRRMGTDPSRALRSGNRI